MLQGLLGSDDEEQEDPKDYCKGEAWSRVPAVRLPLQGLWAVWKEGAQRPGPDDQLD
jgi:hypothetical protein